MRALVLVFVALLGCDNVFRLTPLPDPAIDAAGATDGDTVGDVPIDSPSACAVG